HRAGVGRGAAGRAGAREPGDRCEPVHVGRDGEDPPGPALPEAAGHQPRAARDRGARARRLRAPQFIRTTAAKATTRHAAPWPHTHAGTFLLFEVTTVA